MVQALFADITEEQVIGSESVMDVELSTSTETQESPNDEQGVAESFQVPSIPDLYAIFEHAQRAA